MSADPNDGTSERMSDVEALMWSLDADPVLSSTFANITFFDIAPDPERLRRRLWRATRVVPRLRRRVVDSFGPGTPVWEDDPTFDLDTHLRWVELPAGATDADARALAVQIAATPFDRTRPLWEFTVIDGLPDGRAAMVQKMHHTITDGKGGIRMSVEFIDAERDAPEPPQVGDGPPPAPARPPWAGAVDAVSGIPRRGADVVRRLAGTATDWARDPLQVASLLAALPAETAATTRSLVRQLGVVDSHRSPLWSGRSLDRGLETFEVSLADAKAAATALGGSVNDLFVAAAAGGSGSYHRREGVGVAELRMSMPVSTRTDRSPGGNAFTPTRVLVPLTEDPATRFAEVHERLAVTKTERAMGLTTSLAGLVNLLPQPMLVRLARQQVLTVDFATSNVRAAPFDLFIAGALITGNYPLGPIAGTAWNLTTMSYRGDLDLGLHVDLAAIPRPEQLRDDIAASFAELIALGTPKRRRRR
ncbi:wax ester/triacylglycerol synthase domain-containing protein [Aquihabitans sp. McL0605]|uniref:wax ester/triacylglycerol synthase domain-containing protein n=1 Tax=Aquihabitans sp. McL0605 TaxID=3415671 RepID=UPI003CEE0641